MTLVRVRCTSRVTHAGKTYDVGDEPSLPVEVLAHLQKQGAIVLLNAPRPVQPEPAPSFIPPESPAAHPVLVVDDGDELPTTSFAEAEEPKLPPEAPTTRKTRPRRIT